jgi:UDP-glucuronate decarboxylase
LKRILVTGAAGFIGYHLCLRLLEEGNRVIGYDNFISGQRSNIEILQGYENFEFHDKDITIPFELAVDEIYNLASPASPVDYQRHPLETLKTNFIGAVNVLEVARANRARILQASTSEVYGDPLVHPQSEDYFGHVNPIGVRSCYDEGKRVAESLFFEYLRQYQTDIKVVRIFNTYGPRMRQSDGRVISNFINQALRGENLTIYGEGDQTRSFCYIADTVEGLIRFMERDVDSHGPLNIGNPEEISMIRMAQLILDKTDSKSRLTYFDRVKDDPMVRKPDIQKAQRILGWEPGVSLSEGLDLTIAYFSKIGDESDDDTREAHAV